MSEFQAALKEELLKFEEEEVYEKIEAPKWVDLTRPDRSIPVDDVAWFCLKVGCDQKHEQPMDPAALKRSFLLRVMAARSPNVKCRRSPNVKCPLSAPPKSRYRTAGISRIPTLVSQKSISVAETGKVHPVLKLKSTPNNGKLRQNLVSVKALTTPRHKNFSTNQEPFRSVQNGKVRTFVPKTRMVAKALVFQTPKKEMKKKLEIGSSGKQAPEGQFVRSIRCARDDPSCSLPASTPVKSHVRACKMNQTEKSSSSRNHKDSEVAVKYRKKRGVGNLKKNNGYVRQMDVADEKKLEQLVGGDESSDMEVDGNSRNCSLDTSFLRGNSEHCKRNEDGILNASNSDRKGVSEINGEAPSKDINCRKNDEQTEGYLDPNPEEAQKEELDHRPTKENLGAPSRSENELGIMEPGNQSDRSLKNALSEELSSAREKSRMVLTEITRSDSLSHSKEKYLEEQGPLPQTSNRHDGDDDDDDDDDKENTLASANNRDLKSTNHSERKLRKIEACENLQKTKTAQGIPTAAQAGKHYKIKPTNPKPFRLRTDERGILKEANLERRLQLLSLKEAASNGNLQRWNGEKIQRDEKSHPQPGQSKSDSKQGGTSVVGTNRKIQKAKPQNVRPTCHKLEETCTYLKRVKKTTHEQKLEESKDNRLAKLRQSKVLEHRPVRPPRVMATTDTHVRRIVREVQVAEACESPTKVCTTTITDRFSSHGKRPGTIPQEPNFHRINVPKTCTKTPIKDLINQCQGIWPDSMLC